MPASIAVTAPSGTASDFNDQLTVAASFAGGDFSADTCGPGSLPGADGSGSVQVAVRADAAPQPGNGGTGGGGGGGGGGTDNGTDEDSDDSPLSTFLVPISILGAVLLARRRRT